MEEAIMSDYQEDDEEPTEADCKVCGRVGVHFSTYYKWRKLL
jgi:transposase-like protein